MTRGGKKTDFDEAAADGDAGATADPGDRLDGLGLGLGLGQAWSSH